MADLKNLKSIELSSITLIGTAINFIWSIVTSIIIVIVLSLILGRFDISFAIIGIAIIFGTIIFSISEYFGIACLYNSIIKKMKNVKINIKDMNRITNVSILPLISIASTIALIVSIIIYPVIFLILSLIPLLSQLLQAISLQGFTWLVYPLSFTFSPLFIAYAFFITFILTAIGTYIFNKINPVIDGLKVSLASEGNLTRIDSINPKSAGIISGIICLIYGFLYGILFSFISGSLPANIILIMGLTIGGLVGGFIYGVINSIMYNFFAKKLTPIKLELENSE